MSESYQHVLSRVRPPRVQITYDVETGGAIQQKELPFVLGILADLAGQRDANVDAPVAYYPEDDLTASSVQIVVEKRAPLKQRELVEIDRDVFDKRLQEISPVLSVTASVSVPSGLGGLLDDLTAEVTDLNTHYTTLVDSDGSDPDGDAAAQAAIDEATAAGSLGYVAISNEDAFTPDDAAAGQAAAATAGAAGGQIYDRLAALVALYQDVDSKYQSALQAQSAGDDLTTPMDELADAEDALREALDGDALTDLDTAALDALRAWRAVGETEPATSLMTFQKMDDFDPGRVLRQIEAARGLLVLRDALVGLQSQLEGSRDLATAVEEAITDYRYTSLRVRITAEAPAEPTVDTNNDGVIDDADITESVHEVTLDEIVEASAEASAPDDDNSGTGGTGGTTP